ncbi:ferredoxin-type protein NapF, partial [Escherichia coli]|nr:ferredoxin-type protein NapF [Escherichia coli]
MPDEIDLARRGLFRGRLRTAEPPVQLPWSVNWSTFVVDCTRCGDCLVACPEQILVNGEGGFPV